MCIQDFKSSSCFFPEEAEAEATTESPPASKVSGFEAEQYPLRRRREREKNVGSDGRGRAREEEERRIGGGEKKKKKHLLGTERREETSIGVIRVCGNWKIF